MAAQPRPRQRARHRRPPRWPSSSRARSCRMRSRARRRGSPPARGERRASRCHTRHRRCAPVQEEDVLRAEPTTPTAFAGHEDHDLAPDQKSRPARSSTAEDRPQAHIDVSNGRRSRFSHGATTTIAGHQDRQMPSALPRPDSRAATCVSRPHRRRRRRCLRRPRCLAAALSLRAPPSGRVCRLISAAGAGWCGGDGQEYQRDRAEHAEQEDRAEDGEQADRAAQVVAVDRGGRERGAGGRRSHLWRGVTRASSGSPSGQTFST